MAVQTAVGNLQTTTAAAGNTVVVAGLGFQPKVLILWWNGLTGTSGGTRGHSRRGMGWAVSDTSFIAQANYDTDAVGTAICKNQWTNTACVILIDDTEAIVGSMDLQSFDADGFTLEILDAFPEDILVSYMAIGGDDITDAEIGSFNPTGTAPVEQTVNTSGGFKPSVVLFMLGQQVGTGADSTHFFGATAGSTQEATWAGGSNDTSTSIASGSYCRSGECIAFNTVAYNATPTLRAELVSFNDSPGGFTLNLLERSVTTANAYLAIKGGKWAVGDFLTQTDTVTEIEETGLGFVPVGLLVVSAGKAATAQDGTFDAHDTWSVGATTGNTNRVVQQVASRSGATDSYGHLAARTDAIYVRSDPAQTNYTLTGLADLSSFDADGFTAIMSDADPDQAFAWYIAVGSNPPPDPEPETAASPRIPRTARTPGRLWRP